LLPIEGEKDVDHLAEPCGTRRARKTPSATLLQKREYDAHKPPQPNCPRAVDIGSGIVQEAFGHQIVHREAAPFVRRPNGLEVNPHGQGLRAEARAARGAPAFEARECAPRDAVRL